MLAEEVFGVNLRHKMKERGIGVKRLSVRTGLGMTTIYEARRGRTVPNVITAWKLAQSLGTTVEELLKGATE